MTDVQQLRRDDTSLSTLTHGIQLLGKFTLQEPELGISELARRLNLSKSAIQRLVSTFVANGFLTRTEAGRYRLGIRLFELGSQVAASFELREVALPYLRQLSREVQETVHLAVRDGAEMVYVEKMEANRTIRMYSRVGRRGPIHCTGVGKAVLAYQPDDVVALVIAGGLTRFTAQTIVDPAALHAELAHVRRVGYAFDLEEIEEGLRCVAAPIRDHERQVIAAISVAGPSQRISEPVMRQLAPRVVEMACRISHDLGYSPPSACTYVTVEPKDEQQSLAGRVPAPMRAHATAAVDAFPSSRSAFPRSTARSSSAESPRC